MQYKNFFTGVFAVLSSKCFLLLGGYDKLINALITFVVIDYITGIARAFKEKKLNSYDGFMGIFKKILLFLVIVLAVVLDSLSIADEPLFRTVAIMFLIANEGLSIIENLASLDVPIPKIIKRALKSIRKQDDDEHEE